jgi:hypothetical protein
MDSTTPAPEPQAKTIVLRQSASAAQCSKALGVELGPDAADMPDACPCCGHRLPPCLPAAWTPGTSAVLDWLTLVEDGLETLATHLRRAVKEVLP